MAKDKKIIVFVDGIGRTIYGEEVSNTKEGLTVKNPAIINVVPNQQTGQLQVQVLPFFFNEFLEKKEQSETQWRFPGDSVTIGVDVDLDSKLVEQYEKMFNPSLIVTPGEPTIATPGEAQKGAGAAKVVKLFDE